MKSISKLEIGYYLPLMALIEVSSILITIAITLFNQLFRNTLFLSELSSLLNSCIPTLCALTILMAIILIVMILLTIKYQRGNTFRNYCNSVFQTYNLRSFSKIQVKTTRVKVDSGWKNQRNNNPAEIAFNRALQGWYIDKRKNNLTVWLLLPESSDGQIIFDQKLPGIENNIRHRYMDYTFSPAERVGNYYRIEATRY